MIMMMKRVKDRKSISYIVYWYTKSRQIFKALFGFFFFYHSLLLTQFSSLITHHLKYPNSLYEVCLAPSLTCHHSIFVNYLWASHTDPKKTFLSSFSFFSRTAVVREVELVKSWSSDGEGERGSHGGCLWVCEIVK